MSIATIRRQVKNVAYNFSDAQVKVREATSNDPWGPSTGLMSEIADLSHNPAAFTEIMSIIWKRLNDHGKNWRHVYKSLVLLDFLIKCGSEKVAAQCRENIYSIETLRDFQHIEEGRDQGMNVREKAKQMAALLQDEERLKNERTRFMITRNRFKQTGGIGHEAVSSSRGVSSRHHALPAEYDEARPTSAGEEEMQMQIALALSKEEHERDEEKRKGEDVLYQMALEESRKESERLSVEQKNGTVSGSTLSQSALDDLLSLGLGEMTIAPAPTNGSTGGWDQPNFVDPWAPATTQAATPSGGLYPSVPPLNDPWAPANSNIATGADPFSAWDAPPQAAPINMHQDPFSPMTALPIAPMSASSAAPVNRSLNSKTPESFLGENSSLVNLDNLMGGPVPSNNAPNPFLLGSASAPPVNPFTANQRKSPTLNEMRAAGGTPVIPPSGARPVLLPQPLQPTSASNPTNPFANY